MATACRARLGKEEMLGSILSYDIGITVLQYYSITVLQHYSITALQYYSITVLQYCSIAVLQYCSITVLQYYSIAVLQYYSISCMFAPQEEPPGGAAFVRSRASFVAYVCFLAFYYLHWLIVLLKYCSSCGLAVAPEAAVALFAVSRLECITSLLAGQHVYWWVNTFFHRS